MSFDAKLIPPATTSESQMTCALVTWHNAGPSGYTVDYRPWAVAVVIEFPTERHAWRSSVLAFIRDHVEAGETYRLDAAALEFGELLPRMPEWMAPG